MVCLEKSAAVGRSVGVALLFLLLAGCGKVEEREVRPWFRIRRERQSVLAPHALGFGENSETGRFLLDGRWVDVAKGYERLTVFRVGGGLLVFGRGTAHLLREGAPPVQLDDGSCPDVEPRPGTNEIVCTGCGAAPPLASFGGAMRRHPTCSVVSASGRDLTGRILWTRTAPWPQLPDGCRREVLLEDGLTRDGNPVYGVECNAPKTGWTKRRFSLAAAGFKELPPGVALETASPVSSY